MRLETRSLAVAALVCLGVAGSVSLAAPDPADQPKPTQVEADEAHKTAANAAAAADEQPSVAPTLEGLKQQRLRAVIVPSRVRWSTPAADPTAEERPRDPTLISVPSNTLGPGEPLWIRSDRRAAEARRARAEAELAESRAELAERDADRLADGDDGVIVYGPHAPRWVRRAWYRPGVRVGINADRSAPEPDLFDRAQIQFGNTAYPRIGPGIEGQFEAQRRFGRAASPPIIETQNRIDRAQLKTRTGAPLPGAAPTAPPPAPAKKRDRSDK